MNFTFKSLNIPDILLITPKKFGDDRGFFMETYKVSEFKANGIDVSYVQDNHSKSKAGVLRGLHYQLKPFDQGKLVRVVSGSLLDVAVDIRKNSPYYGEHIAHIISAENHEMLWIPSGFAHGTLILEDDTELLYKVTNEYSPSHDRGILWNDPALNINWSNSNPLLSDKDKSQPLLSQAENNFIYGE